MITGSIRSGTSLISRSVDAHPQVTCLLEPYMGFFRSYRNALYDNYQIQINDPNQPITDHFLESAEIFEKFKIANLNITLIDSWEELKPKLISFSKSTSSKLIPYLDEISDVITYKDLFIKLLRCSRKAYGCNNTKIDGFVQGWVEFFVGPLLSTFNSARCVHVIRDPRAMIASWTKTKHLSHNYPFLMVLRHWRKSLAMASRWNRLYPDRHLVIRYEDFVNNPEHYIKQICKFCDVDYSKECINTEKFLDGNGNPWKANTSFTEKINGIDSSFTNRWKHYLNPDQIFLIEMLCAAEMDYWGYQRTIENDLEKEINLMLAPPKFEHSESGRNDWINKYNCEYESIYQIPIQELGRWMLYRQRNSTKRTLSKQDAQRVFLDPEFLNNK